MSHSYAFALAEALIIYSVLALSLYGWGRVVVAVLGIPQGKGPRPTIQIWLGWAALLFFLELLNLFFPLTVYAVLPVVVAGALVGGASLTKRDRWRSLPGAPSPGFLACTLLALVAVIWIASRSMRSPTLYDCGLYYLQAIRWINSYATVPGLGNLHSRLAFNQSFFAFAAALNFYPYFNHGHAIASSFLVLVTAATAIDLASPLWRRRSSTANPGRVGHASAFFILPLLSYLVLFSRSEYLSSPAPDFASSLLGLVLFLLFVQYLLARDRAGGLGGSGRAAILLVLAATLVTVKLSNLVFAGTIAVLVALLWAHDAMSKRQISRRLFARAVGTSLLVLLPWSVKGFILSGTPLYPSLVGYGIVRVDWSVPRPEVVHTLRVIRAWARQPRKAPAEVLRNWAWLRPWLMRMKRQRNADYSLAVSVLFFGASVWLTWIQRRRRRRGSPNWLVVAPELLALGYWFAMAPAPRFATAELWCLAYGSSILFLQSIEPQVEGRKFAVAFGVVFLLVNLSLITTTALELGSFASISRTGWQPIPKVQTIRETTVSGLTVLVPKKRDQCWNAPLPCTPRLDPHLRLRIPGDLASGFRISKAQASPELSHRSAAPGENKSAP